MRKTMSRLFTAVLMVMLLCSLTIISASAADEHATCSAVTLPEGQSWQTMPEASSTGISITTSGYYYLAEAPAAKITVGNGTDSIVVNLCMCGLDNVVSGSAALHVKGKATVNIYNCQTGTGGKIKATGVASAQAILIDSGGYLSINEGVHVNECTGREVILVNGGTLVMNDGSISGNTCTDRIVWVNGTGSFTMNGGAISGNKLEGTVKVNNNGSGNGGAVELAGAGSTFTMNGGTIGGTGEGEGNTAPNGGGVYVYAGTFTMKGGTISGNTATTYGGGVFTKGTFNMEGGTIISNTATTSGPCGGGVYVNAGTFNLKGGTIGSATAAERNSGHTNGKQVYVNSTLNMTGGTIIGDGNMLYGSSSCTMNLSGGLLDHTSGTGGIVLLVNDGGSCSISGQIAIDGKIHSAGTYSITGGRFSADPTTYGTTPVSGRIPTGYSVSDNSSALDTAYPYVVTDGSTEVGTCENGHKGWKAITNGGTISADGEYFLGAPLVSLSSSIKVEAGNVTICMCGHDLSGGAIPLQVSGGKVILKNCKDNGGKITYTGTDNWRAIQITGGEVEMGNGVHVTGCTNGNAAEAVYVGAGTFTMTGGSITNNTCTHAGGVRLNAATAVFNMSGGEISGNACTNTDYGGGAVCVNNGEFTMSSGATIKNNTNANNVNGLEVYLANGGSFGMTGGSITGGGNMICTAGTSGAQATISGGTLVSTDRALFTQGGGTSITVEGTAEVTGNLLNIGSMTIRAGKINGTLTNHASATGTITVEGGKFSDANVGNYLADGKQRYDNTDDDKNIYPYVVREKAAEPEPDPDHTDCTAKPGITGWNMITAGESITTAGHYYLGNSITNGCITVTAQDVVLCMKGYNLASTSGIALYVNGGEVEVCNCGGTSGGKISASAKNAAVQVSNGGTVTIGSGVSVTECASTVPAGLLLTGGTANLAGGSIKNNSTRGVYLHSGTSSVTLSAGGEISNNTSSGNGGGVYAKVGSFTMTGGTITGNTAANGGGVYVEGGTFEMSGNAAITGNTATASSKYNEGGAGVYVKSGAFNMEDGSIAENTGGKNGGGILITGGAVTMEGGAISGGSNTVYAVGTSTFTASAGTVTNTQEVIGNAIVAGGATATITLGGSVAVIGRLSNSGTITISGGKFSDHTDRNTLGSWVEAPEGNTEVLAMADITKEDDIAAGYAYTVGRGLYSVDSFIDFQSSLDLSLILGAINFGQFNMEGTYDLSAVCGETDYDAVLETIKLSETESIDVITIKGIVAKAMDDKITVTLKENDITLLEKTLSIRSVAGEWYAEDTAENAALEAANTAAQTKIDETEDETVKAAQQAIIDQNDAKIAQNNKRIVMLVDMINYGIEAQKAFEGNVASMTALSEEATATTPRWNGVAAGHGVNADHVKNVAVTLSLKNQIELNVYVNSEVEVTAATMNDAAIVPEIKVENGITRISFKEIPVVNAGDAVNLTVSNGAQVIFSITDYGAMVAADETAVQKPLASALLKYIESVYNYMGKTDEQ